jgi:predicted transcriptional regulator
MAMYIHHMVRTQIYLDDTVHARLRDLAVQQGRTVSDLIREALARVFGETSVDHRLKTLGAADGLWRNREELGDSAAYVRHLRHDTRRNRKS